LEPTKTAQANRIEETLASFVTDDGLFAVDRDQRIVYWAASAERVLGFSADEVLGRPCYEVLGASEPSGHPHCKPDCQVVANARRGRPIRDFDVRVKSDDRDAWLNVTILLAPTDASRSPLAVHLVRDVTDRRKVESLRTVASADRAEGGAAAESHGHVPPLSRREQQVIALLAQGFKSAEIARALGLSPVTIRNHITRAMSKLGVHSRLEAVVRAAKLGFL